MTFHQNLPAPAKGDRDTDMQTSTQDSTNTGVDQRSKTHRNHPILLRPILPRPTLPPPTLPTSSLPMPTLPTPILLPPTLPTPAFVQFPPREPDLRDEIMAIVQPKKSKTLPNSILGKRKAMLGDRIGTDNRKRLEIRWEGTTMLGDIDGEFKPAVWHEKIRDRLILMDAQQPGAPVWRPDMSLDYTSYSPFISDWTDDLATILDDEGRQVCLMDDPPKDWEHNPERPYLLFEGKYVLDINNRPIKDYKGAPRTISIEARPSLLEGLYRTLGMTNSDMRARMRPIRFTSNGIQLSQSYSLFTNQRNDWKKKKNMKQWHWKASKKNKKTKKNKTEVKDKTKVKDKNKVKDEDKVKDDDKAKEEEKAYLLPESMDTDDTGLTLANRLLSTMPEPSSAMTASNGLSQHPARQAYPQSPQDRHDNSAGATGMSTGSYSYSQPTAEFIEQSREAAWANAQTFPAANMPVSNTNPPATGINSSGYPSTFAHQYIHPGQGPMSAGAYSYGQPTTEFMEQSREAAWANAPTFPAANMPVSNTSSTTTGYINAPGYPSRFSHQNIYPEHGSMLAGSYSYGQPTTGYVGQTREGNIFNVTNFPKANMLARNANVVGPGNMTTSGYPVMYPQQNTYTDAPHPFGTSPLYTPPLYNTNYNQHTDPTLYSTRVRAPTHPVARPILGGFNRPDPNRRYEVDDFWEQELARQEPLATNFPAQVQATPQPAGPPWPQPLGAAFPTPVQPAESAPTALSSPAGDAFLGAEYSPVSPEDWLNSEEVWRRG